MTLTSSLSRYSNGSVVRANSSREAGRRAALDEVSPAGEHGARHGPVHQLVDALFGISRHVLSSGNVGEPPAFARKRQRRPNRRRCLTSQWTALSRNPRLPGCKGRADGTDESNHALDWDRAVLEVSKMLTR